MWGKRDAPALRIKRPSSLFFNAAHALLDWQSSLPQQQVVASGGSGDGTRLKLESAAVRSSIVAVTLRKLLGESGVPGLDVTDIVQVADASPGRPASYVGSGYEPRCRRAASYDMHAG